MQYERRYAPLMLLALGFGLFVGAIIMAGLNAPPAQVGSLDGGVPNTPPGGVFQQATPQPDVPLPVEEMTVIEPVKVAEPRITEAMLREYEKSIFHEVNRRRVENGLHALIWDEKVAAIARFHSSDEAMRGYYAHQDPEGRGPAQRFGYSDVAENGMLIEYYTPPLQVDDIVNSWWNSQGHRASMLSTWSQRTGVGVAIEGSVVYITQNFVS